MAGVSGLNLEHDFAHSHNSVANDGFACFCLCLVKSCKYKNEWVFMFIAIRLAFSIDLTQTYNLVGEAHAVSTNHKWIFKLYVLLQSVD